MKSTTDKLKVMQGFLDGETIKLTDHQNCDKKSLHNTNNVKDLMWDWIGYDYEIVPRPMKGNIHKWVNITESGNVRQSKFFASEGEARMNIHTCDVRVGVKVLVEYKEVVE